MGQSLVKCRMHFIFSTKGRYPFISSTIEQELFAYIAGTCKNLESRPYKVGGHLDHVHILCDLSKNISQAAFVKNIKQHSSQWMKVKLQNPEFFWQNGYAAYSIHEKLVDVVSHYIAQQKIHHQKVSFKDELRSVLIENNLEFDERYLWD